MPILKPRIQDYQERTNIPPGSYRFRVTKVSLTNKEGDQLVDKDDNLQAIVTSHCENPPQTGKAYFLDVPAYLTWELQDGFDVSSAPYGDPRESYVRFCEAISEDHKNTDTVNWYGRLYIGEVREYEGSDGNMRSVVCRFAKIV